EHVGWRRWAAVILGFAGVMVALAPTGGALTPAAMIAIAGSISFAILMVLTRLVRGTSDTVLVTTQTVGALVFGLVAAPFTWVALDWQDTGLLVLLGVVSMVAYLCVNRSLRLAPATVVVPYQYSAIMWAILFGFIFFGDTPRASMLTGAGIIIAAGIYIFIRERTLAKPVTFVEPP
ncbi:MAG: DMT family transporter, partial [Bradyrhizobium sp.]